MKVSLTALSVPWRAPLAAAHGSGAGGGEGDAGRPLLLLALTGSDGVTGYGEAAPLEGYDGVSMDAVREALARCERLLASSDGSDREALLAACAKAAALPEALAAIDMALWDLCGRRAGEPVWRLLGAEGLADGEVAVNATIGAEAPAQAADEAAAAVAAGFRCVKVKVGVGEDERRLAAVRAAVGPEVAIRVDANGAWSVAGAVEALRSLGRFGLELCEEPVHGLDEVRRVAAAAGGAAAGAAARGGVAIAIDESARDPGWAGSRVCDAICLKVGRCGGISGVVRDAASARRAGYEVYLSSTLDGPLGIAAALHAAAAVAPDRPCGLATLARFDRPDPLAPRGGSMSRPAGAGLGDGLIGWYRGAGRAAAGRGPSRME